MRASLAPWAALALMGQSAAAAPCTDDGKPEAKDIFYYSGDPAVLEGLDTSLKLGLEPSSFPRERIEGKTSACTRTTFDSGAITWLLFGSGADAPPRWATSAGDPNRIVFLALMPGSEEARRWVEAVRKDPAHPPEARFTTAMFALTIADGDRRDVYEFLDRIPDNVRLAKLMANALEGRTPVLLSYDVRQHSSNFYGLRPR